MQYVGQRDINIALPWIEPTPMTISGKDANPQIARRCAQDNLGVKKVFAVTKNPSKLPIRCYAAYKKTSRTPRTSAKLIIKILLEDNFLNTLINCYELKFTLTSQDPGKGAFLTPGSGSGIRCFFLPLDPDPG